MTFELIVIACVALATAGIVLGLTKVLRIRLPKVVLPIAIGVAMLAYTQWSRYSWADRTIATLPKTWVAVDHLSYDGILEPWAMMIARTDRLLVLDRASIRSNPAHPDIKLVRLILLEQYQEEIGINQFVDCVGKRRATPSAETTTDESGLPPNDMWIGGGTPPGLYTAVCATS